MFTSGLSGKKRSSPARTRAKGLLARRDGIFKRPLRRRSRWPADHISRSRIRRASKGGTRLAYFRWCLFFLLPLCTRGANGRLELMLLAARFFGLVRMYLRVGLESLEAKDRLFLFVESLFVFAQIKAKLFISICDRVNRISCWNGAIELSCWFDISMFLDQ